MTYEQLNTLAVWQRMPTIDLDRIAAVRLMNRVDTKYLLDEACCMRLFEMAAAECYVQEIDSCRACRYETLYYDTPQWEMYRLHHNRRLTRRKVRTRTYVETGVSYLEVKHKSNKGRTHKHRIRIAGDIFATAPHDAAAADFLRSETPYAPETLTPALTTRFVRVTLVNRAMTERLTLDFDLHFTNERGDGATASMQGLVIVELKQDALAPSPMKDILAQLRVKPFKVSKYCVGEAMTNPQVKHNRFKAKLRAIAKMSLNANKTTTL